MKVITEFSPPKFGLNIPFKNEINKLISSVNVFSGECSVPVPSAVQILLGQSRYSLTVGKK